MGQILVMTDGSLCQSGLGVEGINVTSLGNLPCRPNHNWPLLKKPININEGCFFKASSAIKPDRIYEIACH